MVTIKLPSLLCSYHGCCYVTIVTDYMAVLCAMAIVQLLWLFSLMFSLASLFLARMTLTTLLLYVVKCSTTTMAADVPLPWLLFGLMAVEFKSLSFLSLQASVHPHCCLCRCSGATVRAVLFTAGAIQLPCLHICNHGMGNNSILLQFCNNVLLRLSYCTMFRMPIISQLQYTAIYCRQSYSLSIHS